MRLINIGFGNLVSSERLLTIVGPDSAPIKRMIQEARDRAMLIDASYGRKTRAVLLMDTDHVILSAIPPETIARRLADLGAGWITLHPRHAVQGFSGRPRHSAVAELAHELSVPVIASGDLFTAADGVRTIRETGAASVMYARGALKNPAVFAEHGRLIAGGALEGDLPKGSGIACEEGRTLDAQHACDVLDDLPADRAALFAVIRRHAALARRYAPEHALLKMRTFVPRYVKNLDGARALRQEIVSCRSWDELDDILNRYLG